MKSSMVFYSSFYEVLSMLPKDEAHELLMAIIEYGLMVKKEVQLTSLPAQIAWTCIQPQLDANIAKYRNGVKGGEHGCKGGAPKGNKNASSKTTPKQPQDNPKTTPNVNVNVNVNDNVSTNVDIKKENNKKKSEPLSEEEQRFVAGMTSTYPHVMKMQQPLTLHQYQELCSEYSSEKIKEVLVAMENYKQLTSKNRSAVLTIKNWIRRNSR